MISMLWLTGSRTDSSIFIVYVKFCPATCAWRIRETGLWQDKEMLRELWKNGMLLLPHQLPHISPPLSFCVSKTPSFPRTAANKNQPVMDKLLQQICSMEFLQHLYVVQSWWTAMVYSCVDTCTSHLSCKFECLNQDNPAQVQYLVSAL